MGSMMRNCGTAGKAISIVRMARARSASDVNPSDKCQDNMGLGRVRWRQAMVRWRWKLHVESNYDREEKVPAMILKWGVSPHLKPVECEGSILVVHHAGGFLRGGFCMRLGALCILGSEGVSVAGDCGALSSVFEGHRGNGGQGKEERGEGMRGVYSTPPHKKSAPRAGRGAKQGPVMRATQLRAGLRRSKRWGRPLSCSVSAHGCCSLRWGRPLSCSVSAHGCCSLSKTAVVIGGRKMKAPKVLEPLPSKKVQISVQALYQGVPPSTVVDPEPCKPIVVTKEGKKGASKAQQPEQGLKIAMPQGQDAIDGCNSRAVPRCYFEEGSKGPKGLRGGPTNKTGRTLSIDAQGLKIAMPRGQDAPLSTDVPRELCHGATLKKAPKDPKGLKIAMLADQDAPLSDVPWEPCQDATLKKTPKEAQPPKQDLIVFEGSGPLKAQKSGQAKEVNGTAGSKPPKTQVNKRKAKADVKEKEGTGVPEQHNLKRLKKMKEVGVREVAFEWKLAIDEVKVKGRTIKGQLENVSEDKIALKRDDMKKKSK
ncbi:hypothetical protein L7F22_061395 [Adiantum nelumboides]|nr:hypothetical protein [Adiantum nelumboides]